MSEEFRPPAPGSEAVFSMDPVPVLLAIARQVVDGQKVLADIGRGVNGMSQDASEMPGVQEMIAKYEALNASWHTETLPVLFASLRLALEVHDTFGPGRTVIEDPTDAAIWNNKHHVWTQELRQPGH